MKFSIYLSIALHLTACSAGGFNGAWSDSKTESKDEADLTDSSDTVSHKKGDGRRPTEEGEGVPGYLTDPTLLSVEIGDGFLTVNGEPGSVIAQGAGAVSDIIVCMDSFEKNAVVDQKGVTLARVYSEEDGSFSLSVQQTATEADMVIVINVSGQCSTLPADSSGGFIALALPPDATQFKPIKEVFGTEPTKPAASIPAVALPPKGTCAIPDEQPCDQYVTFDLTENTDDIKSMHTFEIREEKACGVSSVTPANTNMIIGCQSGGGIMGVNWVCADGWMGNVTFDVCTLKNDAEMKAYATDSCRTRCEAKPPLISYQTTETAFFLSFPASKFEISFLTNDKPVWVSVTPSRDGLPPVKIVLP